MYTDLLKHYDIILASKSPRRRELLTQAGIPFRCESKDTSEQFPEGTNPIEVVLMLCARKAAAFEHELEKEHAVVITADTIVVCENEIINKPAGEEDAVAMLTRLSGKTHIVHTGVCIRHNHHSRIFYDTTTVGFKELSEAEIRYYVRNYMPYDKAGAYGIQEWIGYIGINRIEGSYPNVMGLPIHRVYDELITLLAIKPE
jgi:septum formation protein